jgi:preprotein translocase subunit SecG
MALLGIVLLVLLVITSVLLVLIILVQDEQGEGIGGMFAGGGTTAFGSRTGNVLTRFTAALAVVFLFCCLAIAWVNRSGDAGNVVGKAREKALSTETTQQWWVESSPTGTGTTIGTGTSTTTPTSGGQ